MLSIKKKITPKQASHYYQKENYYTADDSLKNSEWFGCGGTSLGLGGHVVDEDFRNLLYGKSPSGEQQLIQIKGDPDKRRAAIDLTFSAPKSLSLAALIGGDQRLLEAHREAVRRTLEIMQERLAQTRITIDGNRQVVDTGNLTIAQFHHDTSRRKDPQVHTHCVVMNMTQMENGRWQSLHNDQLFSNKIFLGQIYRNELAHLAQKLGYETEQREDGLFEIKGYTQEQLDGFSKGSEQIEALVGKDASSKQKEWAALKTRPQKSNELPFYQRKHKWELEAESMGIQHLQPKQVKTKAQENSVDKAIAAGIEHCSERNVNFERKDIEDFVIGEVGRYSWSEIQSAINSDEDLLKAKNGEYTTHSALSRELDTIRLVRQGENKFSAIASPEAVSAHLGKTTLNEGQQAGVIMMATTTDQFTALVGVAGSGKTKSLEELKAITAARGYKLKGLAPSAEAAKVLGEDVGIEAETVASLLISKSPKQPEPNQIWIVDEFGLASAKDAHALLQRATQERARVILIGDTRQLSAVEAGNPLKSLVNGGIQTTYLTKSRRQEVADLKEAVDLVADGKISEGIQRLKQGHPETGSRITLIADRHQRAIAIKDDFMALTPAQRKEILILAGTNAERLAITEEIRKALKATGALGAEARLDQLKSKDLTEVQMRFAHHFDAGDVVMPLRDYKRLGLDKGALYTVTAKDKDTITLKSSDGSTKILDPAKFKKAVYERREIEIAQGDRLRWLKNNRPLKRLNGQQFTVVRVDQASATAQIEYQSGKREQINLNEPQHLDHALVSTTYSSQGKTASRVIVAASNDRTLSKESFYVAVSRARHNLKIYAPSEESLFEKADQSRAKKNPLEVVLKQHEAAKTELKESLSKLRESQGKENIALPVKVKVEAKVQGLSEVEQQNLRIKR